MNSSGSPLGSTLFASMPRASNRFTSSARSLATAMIRSSYTCCATAGAAAIARRNATTSVRARLMNMAIDLEQAEEIGGRCARDRVDGHLAKPGEFLGDVFHERRFVPLAAMRHRRQIRAVGLDQHPLERHAARDVF